MRQMAHHLLNRSVWWIFTMLSPEELHERGSHWKRSTPMLWRNRGTERLCASLCLPSVLGDVGGNLSSAALPSCCHVVSLLKIAPVQPLLTNSPPLLTLGFWLPLWLQKSYWTFFCHWLSWAILIGLSNFRKWESGLLLFSRVQLFAAWWTAAHQVSLFFAISRSLLKLMSIESVMPSSHFVPFSSCLQFSQHQGLF